MLHKNWPSRLNSGQIRAGESTPTAVDLDTEQRAPVGQGPQLVKTWSQMIKTWSQVVITWSQMVKPHRSKPGHNGQNLAITGQDLVTAGLDCQNQVKTWS